MFDRFPKEWWWQIEKPHQLNRLSKPKSKEKWKYQIYLSNGEMIGSQQFWSHIINTDEINEAMLYNDIFNAYRFAMLKKIDDLRKEKGEHKKTINWCQKELETMEKLLYVRT